MTTSRHLSVKQEPTGLLTPGESFDHRHASIYDADDMGTPNNTSRHGLSRQDPYYERPASDTSKLPRINRKARLLNLSRYNGQ